MREIIFRGKCLVSGDFVYGDLIQYEPIHCIRPINQDLGENYDYDEIEVDNETIGQFTGLTDKNGNKIFEGDIYIDEQGDLFKVIKMDCGRYALELIEDGYIDEFIDWSYVEIIGNIHETNQ